MSIEIWQFPERGHQSEIVAALKAIGFVQGRNAFWPGPKGTVSLFWGDAADYKSTSGVDTSVFHLDAEGKGAWGTENNWCVRTRTSIWASSFDQEFQNVAVRHIRSRFGGMFYNDHFGRNRYNVITRQKSTPASRGLFALVTRLTGELDALEHALPQEFIRSLSTPQGQITPDNDLTGVLRLTKQMDPSRVVYNALIPFLVATIEHFFRGTFEVLLRYDTRAIRDLEGQNRKVAFAEAAAVSRSELAIERIASNWFSFQNLDSIHKAFKEILDIDIWRALRRRRKVRTSLPLLSESLQNLITARHGVVHHFSLDRQLDRDAFLNLLHLVKAILEAMTQELEQRLKVKLSAG